MPHVLTPLLREPDAQWHIVNTTRGTTLATHVESALDSKTRNRGLLGRDGLPDGHALVIAPSNAVHTFFMRFPIDVIFVARDGTVLRVRRAVRPWRLTAAWNAFAVVELAAGGALRSPVDAGDRLSLVKPGATPAD